MRRSFFSVGKIISTALFSVVIFLTPVVASAYSGYGTGTSNNPYRISSCAQLQEIDSNLSSYYIVVSDIDCGASLFNHLANNSAFTGTLDGQNHTIKNLNLDASGLFYQTNGATIKNLKIQNGNAYGISYAGSFVALATNTTLSNLHSAMSVSSTTGGKAGGIVGVMYGGSSVTSSSFEGTVTANGHAGGIVGVMQESGTSVYDSFSSGAYYSNGGYFGGIVGGLLAGTVSRVYSSGSLHLNNNITIGGLVGLNQATLRDSFSASLLIGNTSQNGAIAGSNSGGSYSNLFFDQTQANTANVCGSGSGCSATAVNISDSAPNYFKNNTTVGPINAWDFSNTWTTTNNYPRLRSLSNFSGQAGVPNGGDANEDGTPDSYQPTVASAVDGNGVWSTIQIPTANNCTVDNAQAVNVYAIKDDAGYTPQTSTMTAFDLYCASYGMSVPVTIIFDKVYDISKTVLRHFNPTTNNYSTVTGANFGTTTVGGVVKTTVTYSITDGGAFDTDGVSNGVIKDPVGLEIIPTNIGVPNSGLPQKSSQSLVILALIGSFITIGALYARKEA